MAEHPNTDWARHLTPDSTLRLESDEDLVEKLHRFADWIEGGDPNYIEDLYRVAFEQGRRLGVTRE